MLAMKENRLDDKISATIRAEFISIHEKFAVLQKHQDEQLRVVRTMDGATINLMANLATQSTIDKLAVVSHVHRVTRPAPPQAASSGDAEKSKTDSSDPATVDSKRAWRQSLIAEKLDIRSSIFGNVLGRKRADSEVHIALPAVQDSTTNLQAAPQQTLIAEKLDIRSSIFGNVLGRKRADSEVHIALPAVQDSTTNLQAAPQQAPVASKNFSKVPKEVADANLPKPELMRLSTVYELIETELDYGKDLMTMIHVFFT
jgi:hypothetical protein